MLQHKAYPNYSLASSIHSEKTLSEERLAPKILLLVEFTGLPMVTCKTNVAPGLVVVPSIVQCICMVDSSAQSQIIAMCCIYTPLINSFNMVLLFMYRQKDFRNAAIHGLKW
ncbi:hypothetical protein LOAG_13651, partial [Loa loa]